MFPVAWPIASLLDCLLGEHGETFYRRGELKALIKIHEKSTDEAQHGLNADEVKILRGALDLSHKTVGEVMTPINQVFMVEESDVLNQDLMIKIWENGHSRLPVYKKHRKHVVGVLLTKSLIIINASDNLTVSEAGYIPIPHIDESVALYDVLNLFQIGKRFVFLFLSCIIDLNYKI